MEMQPVKASMLASVGYDEFTSELCVKFTSGSEYWYADVPQDLVDEMMKSESIGKFFNAKIKGKFTAPPDYPHPPAGAAPAKAEKPAEAVAAPVTVPTFDTPEAAIETALAVAEPLRGFQITTTEQRAAAGDHLVSIAKQIKDREEFFKPMKDAAFKAHRAICAKEGEALAPLVEARAKVTEAMRQFDTAAERARRAEEQRLRQEQEKAHNERVARETKEAAEREAEELRLFGDHEAAAKVIEAPPRLVIAPPSAIVVPTDVPKTAGVSGTKKWDFNVEQPHLVPRQFLMVDEAKIRKVVTAMGPEANIDGVVVFERTDYRVNTKRA